VSLTSPSPAPPGWYPDPAGERQWRVWTGAQWSHLTRPYGPLVDANQVSTHLTLLQALRRLLRYGIVGSFSGLAIIVGVLAHWPGTAHPASLTFCVIALDAGLALLVIGSASFASAVGPLDASRPRRCCSRCS
jgi:hypothetical protein